MKHLLLPFFFILFIASNAQPTNFESKGLGGGGSLFSPSISPLSSTEIYMQCDMSQVFHTTNTGNTWDEVHFTQLTSTGGQHTVEFTNDPNTLYTVNLDFLTDEMIPVKSIDAGATWQTITAEPTSSDAWSIFADPNTSNRILISDYSELFISTDGGTSFQSAHNLGAGFLISGVFWSGNSIFVGTNMGLLVSTNGGTSFSFDNSNGFPSGEGFISFTGSESNGTIRLMGTTAPQGDLYPGVNALDVNIYSSIVTMDYGSGSWSATTSGINTNHDLFMISSSLQDVNTFYVGGVDNNTSFPVVYKTSNGGSSWSEVFLTNNNQNITTGWSGHQGDENWWYGEIVFGLDVAPNDPNTIIITDFGFAHISTDGGNSWNQAYVNTSSANPSGSTTPQNQDYIGNGLENTSAWQLHWKDQNNIFASFTDITGIRSTDAGNSWSFNYAGVNYNTIYHVVEHPTTGVLYAAVSSVHDLYQSTYLTDARIDGGDGAILYSSDNGLTWQMLHDFSMPVVWLAIDNNSPNTIYASVVNSSSGGVFKTSNLSNNASSNWSLTSSPARTEGHPYNVKVLNDGSVVSTWCGRRDPGFTASSGVFHSTNGGSTWQDVSMNDDMHYWTKDITIDPNDASQNTWYASVHSGWGGAANNKGGIYKTTDRGQNWNQINNSYRVESVTVNPTNADELYFTTESEGLWYSSNASSGTPSFSQISAYNFQHPLRVFFNPHDNNEVWITSFGNGLKVANTLATNIPTLINDKNIKLYPNPTSQTLKINSSELGITKINIIDITGKTLKTITQNLNLINVADLPAGIYFIQLKSIKKNITKKFVKN